MSKVERGYAPVEKAQEAQKNFLRKPFVDFRGSFLFPVFSPSGGLLSNTGEMS